ncbi:MAG: TIGR01212 family radical SAM protein [Bacteroidales bacterium]|nr:TIGR01212 family radical SAM protein [Bacteroidales bacterium]
MQYPWGGKEPFYTYHQYLHNTFGFQIRKLPVDAGFTCPNRDGTVGLGGCTFCLNEAFAPGYCDCRHSIAQQVNDGIAFHAQRRRPIDKFFIYFQSFSNTHAPLEQLKKKFEEAITIPDVKGIIVATRPDCLSEKVLDYLSELQKRTYLCVEIGIESLHDETLQRINRGHDVACTLQATKALAERSIPTSGHLIFGLPGETPEDWMRDTQAINNLPLSTIKLHQLQILRGTPISLEHETCPHDFHHFSATEYIAFLADFIERLSPEIAIERLANEVPPRYLAEREWKGIRHQDIVDGVCQLLQKRHSWQGEKRRL